MPAVQESIRVVKKKGKGQGGWIKAMLDSYESIAEDLTKCGYVRREHVVHWVKGEYWDPRGASGWDESLVGQLALTDIILGVPPVAGRGSFIGGTALAVG